MTLLEKMVSKHQISMLTEDDSVVLIELFPEHDCLWNVIVRACVYFGRNF